MFLQVYIYIYIYISCLSVACINICLEVYFGIKKIENFDFLIKMALLEIDSFNFENS